MDYRDIAIKLYKSKQDTAPTDNYEKELGREVLQELILKSLTKTDFYEKAAFHGGTFVRLIHNVDRFSEDLDFEGLKKDTSFTLDKYFEFLEKDFKENGLEIETIVKKINNNVHKGYIKDVSVASALNLGYVSHPRIKPKTLIKFEVDTYPPEGSRYEDVDGVKVVDIESGFSGKLNALLGRAYLKGRDWYDFQFYVNKGIEPNYKLLRNTFIQADEKFKDVDINPKWLCNEIRNKLESISIEKLCEDLHSYVAENKIDYLKENGRDYFSKVIDKFETYSLEKQKDNMKTR